MKFKFRVKGLIAAIEPALNVATTAGIKDYENSNRITLSSEKDSICCLVDNGLAQLKGQMSNDDFSDLEYSYEESGSVTVKAKELKELLASFNPNDTVDVNLISNGSAEELRFSNALDKDVFMSLSTITEAISFPKAVFDQINSSTNSFDIRRDLFNTASTRLAFARGFEDFRPEYKYWVMRASPNKVRFVCGSGARFAVLEYEGKNISNASKDLNILVPGDQSAIITKMMTKISDEMIGFVILDDNLAIKTRNFLISIPNYDPSIQWPDENKILMRESKYLMATRLGDWPSIVRSIMATNNDENKQTNQFHIVTFTINPSSNEIIADAQSSTMKTRRKTRIADLQGELEDGFKLRIESMYVQEAFKSTAEDDYAQWEFNDEGVLILRFYAAPEIGDPEDFVRVNESTGLKERFSMFVATHGEDI